MRRNLWVGLAAVAFAALSSGCHDVHVHEGSHRRRVVYHDAARVHRYHHRPFHHHDHRAPVYVARRHHDGHQDGHNEHARWHHRPDHAEARVDHDRGAGSGTRVRTRAATGELDVRVRVDD
jgi:hypothetical protein